MVFLPLLYLIPVLGSSRTPILRIVFSAILRQKKALNVIGHVARRAKIPGSFEAHMCPRLLEKTIFQAETLAVETWPSVHKPRVIVFEHSAVGLI